MSVTRLIGIAGWRLVPAEPRHNTFHNSLHLQASEDAVPLKYFGLKNTYPTNWIDQVLPDTILKKYPYLSVRNFYRFRSTAGLSADEKIVMYIFEGSICWILFLSLYSILNPNLMVICNLFSSSKYEEILFHRDGRLRFKSKIIFSIISKMKRVTITFDTSTMANKVKELTSTSNIGTFPVTSSFPFLPISRSKKQHFKVLVNLRSFNLNDLHRMLENSCKECSFTFPRGPSAQPSLEEEFAIYPNAIFDQHSIPVEDYMDYFDSFDYVILLYKPTIDASGKLLDAIARRLPVCIPTESLEWLSITEQWGEYYSFKWDDYESMNKSFAHPDFLSPIQFGEPDFTPRQTLKKMQNFHISSRRQGRVSQIFRRAFVLILIFLYSNIARLLNTGVGVKYRLSGGLKDFRG